ncbi:uncharacterized protein BCR38DRAFT_405225 [Pseudomassariella vexata]|uniref:Prolyl 4-hydroxylase alpha subunit domain-containing protein n=1 Tax=Pseudomassariella vexata TaxID=1141098 RepID=A0A1Y2EDX7_9PEZI|nr:uncharacterized protein BCR38DRAFT_405225 [Pseudomassariella vexata]ORY69514.1 hypothetical protein BCR38DRAFT_405225 [Pseudomassariella vexata]
MFPYVVGGIAFLLFFYNPLVEYFSNQPQTLPRTPRPPINESLLAIDAANETAPNCPPATHSVHILSKAPLVIYIENFISPEERDILLDISPPTRLTPLNSDPLFESSTITDDGESTHRNTAIRDSEIAVLPRTELVRCIERRALAFQGFREDLWVERLRTQRYVAGGHYSHHFDWGSGARGWGRLSTFMVWAASEGVEGGGTEFPLLRRRDEKGDWCGWVECPELGGKEGEEQGELAEGERVLGVTFMPVAGNAVFWENFRPDGTGRGWEETWHAGLPVRKGVKVGLNIWSWGRLD